MNAQRRDIAHHIAQLNKALASIAASRKHPASSIGQVKQASGATATTPARSTLPQPPNAMHSSHDHATTDEEDPPTEPPTGHEAQQ